MKIIIAITSTLITVGLMVLTFSQGGAFQGGQQAKGIGSFADANTTPSSPVAQIENNNKQKDELQALKDKAGNAGAFEVSQNYKSKCASCHGVNGSGFQNGKQMMGPKLIGQTEDILYKDLLDFKAGRKENVVMKGLLLNIEKPELKEFAKEIAQFQDRLDKLNNK
ncbi:MAG: hypothetical protein DRG11_00325 [Epsilonproteobacteria bacterium]|nr:MAG: hypothetical protein DRG11_00325 [Campylobacterota bacterium]